MELKKSEALAQNLLSYNRVTRQEGTAFESQIDHSRKLIIEKNRDEMSACSDFVDARYESLTEVDEYSDNSEPFSYHAKSGVKTNDSGIEVKNLDKQKDQVFFEFFSMYTKESVKAQRDHQYYQKAKTPGIKLSTDDLQ